MRKFIIVMLLLFMMGFLFLRVAREKVRHDLAQPINEPVLSPTPTIVLDRNNKTTTSLFVPYWSLSDQTAPADNYDEYIYFGITPTKSGISTSDSGAQNSDAFTQDVPSGKRKLVALRMIDAETNSEILKSSSLQQKVITQTVAFTKANGYDGVVLDLEISGIPFDSLVNQINAFSESFAKAAKKEQLQFDLTLYGDTFYRLRPFDVKTLAKSADGIMLMAYDFHKARSNPGPNFPMSGQEHYGYDIGKMADDFIQAVPNQKLTVVFGLFGYDWEVDNNGKAIAQGVPLTYLQIQHKFLNGCSYNACRITRDSVSAETEIQYTDEANQKHIVWFEDMQSVRSKEQELRKKGITNFSFWANSYF